MEFGVLFRQASLRIAQSIAAGHIKPRVLQAYFSQFEFRTYWGGSEAAQGVDFHPAVTS
jgi:hypothetical protein